MGTDLICDLCAAYKSEFKFTHKKTGKTFEVCKECAKKLIAKKKD